VGIVDFVAGASLPVFLLMAGVPAAMVGIGTFSSLRTRRQMQAIQSTAAISPAAARPGLFRVDGVATPLAGTPLKAPLTRSPCVWYRIRVEEWKRSSSEDSGSWRTLRAEESETPLLLRFDDAEIAVDPYGADVTPTDKSLWYGPREEPNDRNPPRFKPWENPKGEGLQIEVSGTGDRRYRFAEERIYAGDPLFVLGEIVERRAGADEEDDEDDDWIDESDDATGGEAPTAAAIATAADVTSRFLLKRPGDGKTPFLMSTTEPSKHLALQRGGVVGAGFIAVLGLALLVLLIGLRVAS
jgi:hypothetical protein